LNYFSEELFLSVNITLKLKHETMKRLVVLVHLLLLIGAFSLAQNSFYDFKVKTLEGDAFDFASLKGKKVMVVNTASKCGLTPQYKELEELYKTFGPENFVIIGFPANNFMGQEPGTAEQIREFCEQNYGVTFLMMEKISVKGNDMHPVYQWLTQKAKNGKEDSDVKWNFQKYLIDEKGELMKVIPPRTKPLDEEIVNWITGKS
jgi:glutathione peroxidase